MPSHDERSVAWVTQGCPEASLTAPTLLHVGGVEGGERSVELDRVGLTGVAGSVGDAAVVTGFGEPAQLVAADGAVTWLPLRLAASTSATGLVAGLLPGGDAHAAVVEPAPAGWCGSGGVPTLVRSTRAARGSSRTSGPRRSCSTPAPARH